MCDYDYSSIYFDYLLVNRPIVFPYDLESYLAEDSDMYFDYDGMTQPRSAALGKSWKMSSKSHLKRKT